MLHIIQQSPFKYNSLQSCLSILDPGQDALLLIEDGVFAATIICQQLAQKCSQGLKTYVLEADLIARGLSTTVQPMINIINYEEWVDLTTHYYPIQTWS